MQQQEVGEPGVEAWTPRAEPKRAKERAEVAKQAEAAWQRPLSSLYGSCKTIICPSPPSVEFGLLELVTALALPEGG